MITTTTTTNSRRNHSFLHAELLTSPSRGTRLSLQTLRQRADYFREVPEMTSPSRSTPPACERTNERTSERAREEGRLAAKQQGGKAMATLARLIPSPDSFLSEPWSSFVGAVQRRLVDGKLPTRAAVDACLFCGQSVRKCPPPHPVPPTTPPHPPAAKCSVINSPPLSKASQVTVKKDDRQMANGEPDLRATHSPKLRGEH